MTTKKQTVGIDRLSFNTTAHYMDLQELATQSGTDVNKYYQGLRQRKMAIPSMIEDVVTLAAGACQRIVKEVDVEKIDMLLFATESGIDQSKSAGIYVHRLLGLPNTCRVLEFKQACYSATGALQLATNYVRQNPGRTIMIVASDIARYKRNTAAEATQGAAAVAMLVSANPKLLSIDSASGFYSNDVMDFWRPNHMHEPIVDGKYSCEVYLDALEETWKSLKDKTNVKISDFYGFCFHVPFSKMIFKGLERLFSLEPVTWSERARLNSLADKAIEYNQDIGNCYTASLYLSLISLLENNPENMAAKRLGLYSYGSGCTAEFFTATVGDNYRNYLYTDEHASSLASRTALNYSQYTAFHDGFVKTQTMSSSENVALPPSSYTFNGVSDDKRLYSVNDSLV